MRNPYDKIWGLWYHDEGSIAIGNKIGGLISKYGAEMDIIYDDSDLNITRKYSKMYFWNGTTINFSTHPSFLTYSDMALIACVSTGLMICGLISYRFRDRLIKKIRLGGQAIYKKINQQSSSEITCQ